MENKKPKLKLRSPFQEHPIITGGDGSFTVQSPIDPAAMSEAMALVFKQQGIEYGAWKELACRLAVKGKFVTIERSTGPLSHWSNSLRAALKLAALQWAHEQGCSTDAALKSDGFNERWGHLSGQREKTATLSARYYEAIEASVAADLIWTLNHVRNFVPDRVSLGEYWTHHEGLVRALLSDARLERAHEKMMRDLPPALQ